MTVSENELRKDNEWRLKNMKKKLAIILTLSLAACMLALPALAEETAGTVDLVSSATRNNQAGGSRNQMPGQNDQNGQNGQVPQLHGMNNHGGKFGRNGHAGKTTKQGMFDQLLADGVITQEVYDAISAWMQAKVPQAQQDNTAPAEGSEPPALPEGTAPAEGSEPPALPENVPDDTAALQLLKELLDNGTITQEQYDLLAGDIQIAPAAAPET